MAADTESITQQSQATYRSFCRLITAVTLAIFVTLGLMAIFLV